MICMPVALRHDHVALRVTDLDTAIAWYEDKLDFAVEQRFGVEDRDYAYVVNGTVRIELIGGADPRPREVPTEMRTTFGEEGLHHLCVEVDDVDAIVAELDARGVPVIAGPFTAAGVGRRIAFVTDPVGTIIELSARTTA